MPSPKKVAVVIATMTLAIRGEVAPANAMPSLNDYRALGCSQDGLGVA